MASMAVKVMQLESLLQDKQAELQRMGDTGQAWVVDACHLRDAVTSTLAALGTSTPYPPLVCLVYPQQQQSLSSWETNQRPGSFASTLDALCASSPHSDDVTTVTAAAWAHPCCKCLKLLQQYLNLLHHTHLAVCLLWGNNHSVC